MKRILISLFFLVSAVFCFGVDFTFLFPCLPGNSRQSVMQKISANNQYYFINETENKIIAQNKDNLIGHNYTFYMEGDIIKSIDIDHYLLNDSKDLSVLTVYMATSLCRPIFARTVIGNNYIKYVFYNYDQTLELTVVLFTELCEMKYSLKEYEPLL
ncbi:hypothetical protein [Treponema sp.]|uniref:hypothetical protein n=1 Tax=Treponema sp. TaxID=166 RepID=UPI00298D8FC8|nr:hypothetical protein [Treponema sp.]MCQ2242088.1 hypothetical protein [Treponema sp.]